MGIIGIRRSDLGKRLNDGRKSIKDGVAVELGAHGVDLLDGGAVFYDGADIWHAFADLAYTPQVREQILAAEPDVGGWDTIPAHWTEHHENREVWPVLNVMRYGVRNDGTPNKSALVQNMIEEALAEAAARGGGTELYWPPGRYVMAGPVTISRDDYQFYRLRLRGAGKDQTRILAQFDSNSVFRFINTAGAYSAQLSFHGIQFAGGNTAIYIENPFYSEVVDCGFRNLGRQGGYGIHLEGGAQHFRIHNCWFVHTDNILRAVGYVSMIGCDIGEDAGGIKVDGTLQAVGCRWHASSYMQHGQSVTPAAVVVSPSDSFSAIGCTVIRNQGRPFVEVDAPESVFLNDCHYWNYGGSPIVSMDRPGRGVTIDGGTFYTIGGVALWDKHGTAQTIRNCTIRNLRIIDPNDRIITVPDDFFDPDNRNIYEGNQVAS